MKPGDLLLVGEVLSGDVVDERPAVSVKYKIEHLL